MTAVTSLPKYQQIKQLLTDEIRSGRLAPGAQLPPEREIMRRYRVSYATASRAMNELQDGGLVERKWGKGTFVCESTGTSTVNVAVVFDQEYSSNDPYWPVQLKGILSTVHPENWSFQLFPLRQAIIFGEEPSSLLARLLRDREIQGVIVCSPCPAEDLRQLESIGVPIVCMQNMYPETAAPYVMEDTESGARQIVEHLVDELGHRKLRMVIGPQRNHTARHARCSALITEAVERELLARGIRLGAADVAHSDDLITWQSVEDKVDAWLTSPYRPTAIFCVLDTLGCEVIRRAEALGLSVPGDLSVASWYDVVANSRLTTLQVPLSAMAARAVELLDLRLRGASAPHSLYPVSLAVRGTTSHAPT